MNEEIPGNQDLLPSLREASSTLVLQRPKAEDVKQEEGTMQLCKSQKVKAEMVKKEEGANPPTPPSSPPSAPSTTPTDKQLLEDQDTRPLPNYIRRWNNSLDKEFTRIKSLSRAELRPKITTWESIQARKAGVTGFPHTYWDGIVQVKKDWIEYRTGSMEDGLYEWCDGLLIRVFKGWTLYWDFPEGMLPMV